MKNNLYTTKRSSGVDRLLVILLLCVAGLWTSNTMAATITSSAFGGLWNSNATWNGGAIPGTLDDVIIAAGATVTLTASDTTRDLTINGILQWGTVTGSTLVVSRDLLVNPGGKLLAYTTQLVTLQQNIHVVRHFTNNGYANVYLSSVTFRGANFFNLSTNAFNAPENQILSGTGYFVSDSTPGTPGFGKGAFRTISVGSTNGSLTFAASLAQPIVSHTQLNPVGGNFINTNGLFTLNNGAQIFGQSLNRQVSSAVVSAMGSGYTTAPVIGPAGSLKWTAGAASAVGNVRVNGTNVYVSTEATASNVNAPTHPVGAVTGATDLATWLWVGNTGSVGNAFAAGTATISPVIGTQYFYDSNLYTCVTTGAMSPAQAAASPPSHTSGIAFVGGTGVSYLYAGTVAQLSVNWDGASTVRSVNIASTGSGYNTGGANVAAVFHNTGAGSGALVTPVVIQSLAGGAATIIQKSGEVNLQGGINITSKQSVTAISTINGGVNYPSAPLVGVQLPNGYRNLVTAGGAGYTTASVSVSGGVKITGAVATDPVFTVVIGQNKIVSVIGSGAGLGWRVPPTLTIIGDGAGATAAYPAGCLATATSNLTNGTITSFTVTNEGADYSATPTISLQATSPAASLVATIPTARIGFYSVTVAFFAGAANALANYQGAEIPANGRLASYSQNSVPNNYSSNIEIYGTAYTFGGGIIDMGGNTLWFSNPLYAGNVGSAACNVRNGFVQLSSPGGNVSRSFPFNGFSITTGGNGPGTNSTITSLRGSLGGIPSGAVDSGLIVPGRSFRVEKVNASEVYGTGLNPTVTLNFSYVDGLQTDNANLYIAQASSVTGPWTVRSINTLTGPLPATGFRVTSPTTPGPVVLTGNDFFAWAETSPPVADLAYTVARTTSNVYTSIMPAFSGGNGTGVSYTFGGSLTDTDDNYTTIVSIPSSTFTYQGQTITGFRAITNGYLVLTSAENPATIFNTNFYYDWESSLPLTLNRNVIAPFMDDLTANPDNDNTASLDTNMRYSISGAVGSRKIIAEWYRMTLFGLAGPELYFQVVLDEVDKSIKFNYGNIQLYNGVVDVRWTYTCGLGGRFIQTDALPGQALIQQFENTVQFSNNNGASANNGANGLMISPEPRSSLKFTPGATVPVTPPVAAAPVNDETFNATPLPSLTSFPTNIAWNNVFPSPPGSSNFFTTRYATFNGAAPASCGGTATPKDVWFTFTATEASMQVRVYASGGFIPRLQILDLGLALLPVPQCLIGAQGLTVSASMTGLSIGVDYYARVYHDQTGTTATAVATVTNGSVTAVTITNQGSGYSKAGNGQVLTPRISFSGGGGSDAVAGLLSSGGLINGLTLYNGGRGYTSAPAVTIESPDYGLSGEFGIIVFAQASNDDCATAITLNTLTNSGCVNGQNARSGVVTNAANPSSETTCIGTADDDVWYKFDAVNDSTLITVTGIVGFDPVIQVFNGGVSPGVCATKTLLSPAVCQDLTSTNGTESSLVATVIGRTYYVRVYHFGVGSGGVGAKFDICVSSAPPECLASPVSPVNGGNSCLSTLLKWNKAPGATRYDVYLQPGAGPATTQVGFNVTDTTYNAGSLAAGTYAWKIVPKNASGSATGCVTWTFTTVTPPNILISTPGGSSYCVTGSVTMTASGAGNYTWSPAADLSATSGASVVASPPFVAGSYQSDYTYSVIGYSVVGCPDTTSQTVTVNRTPPAPTATGWNQCLSGSTAGQALSSSCTPEILSTLITFTPVVVPLNVNEGSNCPSTLIVGQLTIPALPPGAAYVSARIIIPGVTQRVVTSFASDLSLHLAGTGISGTSGCYLGSTLGDVPSITYVTGAGIFPGDTAVVAALLNPAGGSITITYADIFDENATVPDWTFPGTGFLLYTYSVPGNTSKWYNVPTGGSTLFTGSTYNTGLNSPAGTTPYYARCVTSQGCESASSQADLVIGASISVTASHTATSTICANSPDTLSSTVTGGGQPYSYSWHNGVSVVSTSASFIAFPAATTTYTLTVTHGCTPQGTNTSAVTATVIASPTVNVAQTGVRCAGVGAVTLTASGANTYAWSPAAGLNTAVGAVVVATPAGTTTYTVIGTNTGTGCSTSKTSVVTNYPSISMTTLATPATVCKDAPSQLTSSARYDSIPVGYCIPAQSVNVSAACIDSISFNTLKHKSTACGGSHYVDVPYATATTTLTPGSTYAFFASFQGPAVSTVWIDYNRSGVFAIAEGQQISTFAASATILITIPADAVPGYTKMRVRSRLIGNINTTGTPCGTFLESGSTNDFIVRIGTVSPSAGTFGFAWAANLHLSSTTISNPVATPTSIATHTYNLTVTEASGCTASQSVNVNAIFCLTLATVNLKVFIEGYYVGGGQMTPTLFNEMIPGATDAMVDTVTVEAYDTTTIALVDSYKAVLDTGGNVSGTFSTAAIGTPYYLAVRHRNSNFTWTASPVLLTAVTNYNFTLTASSAYGFKEIGLVDGRFGMYSGDVNQDEYIDTGDVTPVDNDNLSGLFSPGGYWISDINGDGYVDTGDVTPTDNNNLAGIFSSHP